VVEVKVGVWMVAKVVVEVAVEVERTLGDRY